MTGLLNGTHTDTVVKSHGPQNTDAFCTNLTLQHIYTCCKRRCPCIPWTPQHLSAVKTCSKWYRSCGTTQAGAELLTAPMLHLLLQFHFAARFVQCRPDYPMDAVATTAPLLSTCSLITV